MNLIISFFRNSAEWQNWGLNIQTIGAIGTFFFTLCQMYGVWEQRREMRLKKSTESVSETFFAYTTFFYFSYVFYGLSQDKLAIFFNGLFLGPLYFLALVEFFRYRKLNKQEVLVTHLSPAMVPLMLLLDKTGKEILLAIILAGLTFFCVMTFFQMKRSKKRGAVNLKFLIIALSTNSFWLLYSSAIKNTSLIIANLIAVIVWSLIIFLYWKYGPEKAKT